LTAKSSNQKGNADNLACRKVYKSNQKARQRKLGLNFFFLRSPLFIFGDKKGSWKSLGSSASKMRFNCFPNFDTIY
jgi:hypothetical protein